MDSLFDQYVTHLKNMEHFDETKLSTIQEMTPEQKMELIRLLNEVIICLKEIFL